MDELTEYKCTTKGAGGGVCCKMPFNSLRKTVMENCYLCF